MASSERSAAPTPSDQPTPAPIACASPATSNHQAAQQVPLAGRGGAQLAFDPIHHIAVLFGGFDSNGTKGDTWTWDGRQWSQVLTDVAPPARMGGAFIYNPVRHVSVLFGGDGAGGGTNNLCDTWTFDGSRWTQQQPATSPSARAFSTVTFDSHLGEIVLFGGYAAQSGLHDLWAWDGTNWTQMASTANAPDLYPLGLAYRQSDDSLFLAGQSAPGGNGIFPAVLSWAYLQQTWHQVTSGGTVPCVDHYGASAEDPLRGVLVFFGGYCTGATVQWDGNAWTATVPNLSPPNRGNEGGRPAMAYDPDHKVVLLYGGSGGGTYFNDLWAWDGAAWTRVG